MTVSRKLRMVLATGIVGVLLETAVQLSAPGLYGLVSPAEARVGRPLTPVSVAGVARRTARRCAVGVYYC
jgi:hypothetical protein